MVSYAGAVTGVRINLFVALRDVAGKLTYPEEAEQIHQFGLRVSDEDLRNWVHRVHYAAGVISTRENLPESIHEHESDLDWDGRTLLPQDGFVRLRCLPNRGRATHVQMVASHPLPVGVDAPMESLHALSLVEHDGRLSWSECWVVAELPHPASCSARELATRAAPTGWHALVVCKGLTVRTQRVHLVTLESSRSAVISEALDRSRSALGLSLLVVVDDGLDDDARVAGKTDCPGGARILEASAV